MVYPLSVSASKCSCSKLPPASSRLAERSLGVGGGTRMLRTMNDMLTGMRKTSLPSSGEEEEEEEEEEDDDDDEEEEEEEELLMA